MLNQYNKTSHLMYVNSMFCCILFVLKTIVLFFFFALCCFIWFCFAFVFCAFSMLCFFAYFAFCCFDYSCFVLFYCVLFSFSCFVLFYVVFSNSRSLQGLEGFKRMHAWLKELHFFVTVVANDCYPNDTHPYPRIDRKIHRGEHLLRVPKH